jgi:Flp pilus assembly protein TadG
MRRSRGRERGQTIPFVVGITVALLLLVGLSVDGGRILSARERALDEAQEAARTAAQQLDQAAAHGGGAAVLDPAAAARAAQVYLQATGDTGRVVVRGSDVEVTVQHRVSMEMLSLAGLDTVTVTESGSAHAARGTVTGT